MNLTKGDTRYIVDKCKEYGMLRNEAAYILATAYWETARTMKPVREYGGEKYLKKKRYYPYVGMGYVQLTWRKNYKRAGDVLGIDFLQQPKMLLKKEYAAEILVRGMRDGWFTGKKLSDYIDLHHSDYRRARRIVNGNDKAREIEKIAMDFDTVLAGDGYGVVMPPPDVEKIDIPDDRSGLINLIVRGLKWVFSRL